MDSLEIQRSRVVALYDSVSPDKKMLARLCLVVLGNKDIQQLFCGLQGSTIHLVDHLNDALPEGVVGCVSLPNDGKDVG